MVVDPCFVFAEKNSVHLTRVLIDGGSSINILYRDTMEKMGIKESHLHLSKTTFHDIVPGAGCGVMGKVRLDVVFGTKSHYRREPIWFEVVDVQSISCSARPAINYWKLHFDGSKMRTGLGVGIVLTSPKGDKLERSRRRSGAGGARSPRSPRSTTPSSISPRLTAPAGGWTISLAGARTSMRRSTRRLPHRARRASSSPSTKHKLARAEPKTLTELFRIADKYATANEIMKKPLRPDAIIHGSSSKG
jgi:hypothetical protein